MRNAFKRSLLMTASVSLLSVAAFTNDADAAGFHIIEYSPKHQGRANAGAVAFATDPSAVQFNPAALTNVEGPQAYIGAHALHVQMDATDLGSENGGVGDPDGDPLGDKSVNDSDPHSLGLVPNLYVTYPINDKLTWGLGITAPFGLAYEFEPTWFGRLDTVESDLKIINISNVFGYRFDEHVSIGGGFDLQIVDATLKTRAASIPAVNGALPIQQESLVILEGCEQRWGFNVGMLIEPWDGTKIGISYRSGFDYKVEGDLTTISADPDTPPEVTAVKANVGIPGFLNIGFSQELTEDLTLTADWLYTRWSAFESLEVIRKSDGQVLNINNQSRITNYKNAHSVSVGLEYDYDDTWDFRVGFKYDESPVEDEFRNPKTPDEDRYWVTAGFTYTVNECISIDFAYTHIFIKEAIVDIDTNEPILIPGGGPGGIDVFLGGTEGRVNGKFESSVDIISAGCTIKF